MKIAVCATLSALVLIPVSGAPAHNAVADKVPFNVRANYTKQEFHVRMRDGVTLFTEVFVPKNTHKKYPILLLRTPYSVSPYGVKEFPKSLGPADALAQDGFIYVNQDVRGRYLSEGEFIDVPPHKANLNGATDTDPSTDTYDTIDWLVRNVPNNNRRVGTWGVSYPGFYSAFSLIDSHPALKAASPQAPMADVGNGDDAYHNGAFFLSANFGFYTGFWPRGPKPDREARRKDFDFGTEDQYDFYLRMGPLSNAEELCFKHENEYWSDMLEHPNYDEFWASRALSPDMRGLTAPVLVVGGWFDAEDLGGTLKLFNAIDSGSGAPAVTLVMGPWSHGQWTRSSGESLGNLKFGSKTAEFFRDKIEFPFFKETLKGEGRKSLLKAWLFETGKNEWRKFDSWPPKSAHRQSLYLHADGKLSFSEKAAGTEEFDEYVSDPSKPVPVTGEIGGGMPGDYMTRDQRFAARRTDVLTYVSEPLKHDVTVAGPITPVLRVSTSGTDSDFVVKLIDVYPNDTPDPEPNPKNIRFGGYQQLVRGEPFRGKFRERLSQPVPFVPGEPAKIEFAMPDVLHDFQKGHRIMVQIQSSWFPMIDLNPQRFEDIPHAKAADFQKAVERVYRGGPDGTRIEVLTLGVNQQKL